MSGKVYIVGAGPGDPRLITVRGLECIRAADVVVYDRLVDPALLDEAPHDAERVYVGKEPDHHALAQERIHELVAMHAGLGRTVVRLKGGDPFVFGRGGEEAAFLAERGIAYEIVPGVTSAIAVPACAGIPVTHRGISSSFAVTSVLPRVATWVSPPWAVILVGWPGPVEVDVGPGSLFAQETHAIVARTSPARRIGLRTRSFMGSSPGIGSDRNERETAYVHEGRSFPHPALRMPHPVTRHLGLRRTSRPAPSPRRG